MLLTGTYARSLDEKQRVAIPKRLREAMGGPQRCVLYVAPGTDGSLVVYPEASFARIGERFAQASPTQPDVRAYTRLFYSRAQEVEPDGQGRIRIPQELAEWAGLAGEVVLLGVRDHLELWSAERWRAYLAEKQSHYDEIAENAFDRPTGPGAGAEGGSLG